MTTLTIEIPDRIEKTLSDLIIQLGGKVVNAHSPVPLRLAEKKEHILHDLEEAATFVKLHKEGKKEAKSISQLLDEF